MRIRPSLLLCVVLVFAPGCLPYACNRVESRALSEADSLSRAYAAGLPIDTLQFAGQLSSEFEYPRTALYGPGGTLYVTDTGIHRLVIRAPDGRESVVDLDSLRFPYLAGLREGLPVVYSPEANRLAAISGTREAWSMATPSDGPDRAGLRYALVSDSVTWFKALGQDFSGYLARLDSEGRVAERHTLPGPFWRYAGMLRFWHGRPASLSGYRPLVHLPRPGGLDSLALFGFDSPMLARSRQFMMGNVDQPPLLSAAAAAADSLLFVLNMRPGWLRVDVFGEDGRLQRALVEPNPAFNQDFFPTDIAVRSAPRGWDIAVTVARPEPGVLRYTWYPTP